MAVSLGHQEAESLRRDVGIEETGSDPACAAVREDVSPIPDSAWVRKDEEASSNAPARDHHFPRQYGIRPSCCTPVYQPPATQHYTVVTDTNPPGLQCIERELCSAIVTFPPCVPSPPPSPPPPPASAQSDNL
ncbi:hypothetical protein C0Q70_13248 [Pomacea canaliculata]|uniref:Uncharacterized protein n=1 Tax=Pomacea canaliculata TaxID=400727 RepID=A0A2T7NWP1_POMCA|nr:hypothetical protein C0Q70_13248 [Pomacea canaliculata]